MMSHWLGQCCGLSYIFAFNINYFMQDQSFRFSFPRVVYTKYFNFYASYGRTFKTQYAVSVTLTFDLSGSSSFWELTMTSYVSRTLTLTFANLVNGSKPKAMLKTIFGPIFAILRYCDATNVFFFFISYGFGVTLRSIVVKFKFGI